MSRLPAFLTPFSIRNYRLWFCGQLVSLIGSFMTFTALSWLTYDLTRSPLMLGLLAVAGQAPTLLASPLAGVWVDRLDRRKLLLTTQLLSALQSLALTVCALAHSLSVPLLFGLSFFQGIVNAFDLPTRQAMVSQIAEKREHLPAIIGMNSTMFNLGRMLGPALGGILLTLFGAAICFAIDTLSYVAVIAAVAAMRMTVRTTPQARRSAFVEFKEGFRYIAVRGPIRFLMLLLLWISSLGLSFAVMHPAFARDVFGGDAHVLGWLLSASAVGSICGSLRAAARTDIESLCGGLQIGAVLLTLGMLVYALSSHLLLSMLALLFSGMGGVTMITALNTLIQSISEEDKRGRVMSWYGLCLMGGFPIGGLMIGALGSRIGVSGAVLTWAVLTAVATIYLWISLPNLARRAKEISTGAPGDAALAESG
jgi:MFS family permease